MKKFFIILIWFLSLATVSLYTYENPEKIEEIKYFFNKHKDPQIKIAKTNIQKVLANSFSVAFSKVISLSEKTAFIVHDENVLNFDENIL